MSNYLGKRLRRRRLERGLTLYALARQTSLTPSFISQLERGVNSPSLTTLQKLADVLNVPIMYFIAEDTAENRQLTRAGERLQIAAEDVHSSYELLTPNLSGAFEAVLVRLQPGAKNAVRRLPVETEELFYVLEGDLRIALTHEEIILHPGDSLHVNGSLLEAITCAGSRPVTYLSILAPPVF
jgi:transcriptional regulator with XRE-family HTH domain